LQFFIYSEQILFQRRCFILGKKTVMWFIVKLCVGDFLLLLDAPEFDIEAVVLLWLWKYLEENRIDLMTKYKSIAGMTWKIKLG